MGTYQRGSDIDIALKGRKLTSSICSHIHFELEEETLLPYFFDITDYQSIKNEKLKEHIDRVGKIIYGSDDGRWQETEIGKIPSDWDVTTISCISEFVTDGAHTSPKFFQNGQMMCSVKDMRYDGFQFGDCKRISPDNFEKLKRQNCSPQKGDIQCA